MIEIMLFQFFAKNIIIYFHVIAREERAKQSPHNQEFASSYRPRNDVLIILLFYSTPINLLDLLYFPFKYKDQQGYG
jgi:hypothetical protein